MKTVSGIILAAQALGWLASFSIPAFAAGMKGNIEMLDDLRKEMTSALRKAGRPMHLFGLDASRAALVVIDMQNFSCAPPGGETIPGIGSIVLQVNSLADHCRSLGVPVIWVRQNVTSGSGSDNGGLYGAFHGKDRTETTYNKGRGTDLFPEMHFDPAKDHVVFKNRYSAFLSDPPELKQALDSLKRSQLIIAGVAANVCVECTARDAMQLDYEVTLAADATGTLDDALFKSTLKNIMLFFGDVRSAGEVMDELNDGRTGNDGR